MFFEKEVLVEVNGKQVLATVTVSAPGLTADDMVDAGMILASVSANQNRSYISRHHSNRTVRCLVQPAVKEASRNVGPALRLVG